MTTIPVLRIGCLECGTPSELLGIYPDVDAAKAAFPEAELRSEMDDAAYGDWSGDNLTVIFDVAAVT